MGLRRNFMPVVDPSASRRRFLKFLAGSPLLAWVGSRAGTRRADLVSTSCLAQLGTWQRRWRNGLRRSVKELSPAFVRRT
jgi:hypothetical protein